MHNWMFTEKKLTEFFLLCTAFVGNTNVIRDPSIQLCCRVGVRLI